MSYLQNSFKFVSEICFGKIYEALQLDISLNDSTLEIKTANCMRGTTQQNMYRTWKIFGPLIPILVQMSKTLGGIVLIILRAVSPNESDCSYKLRIASSERALDTGWFGCDSASGPKKSEKCFIQLAVRNATFNVKMQVTLLMSTIYSDF